MYAFLQCFAGFIFHLHRTFEYKQLAFLLVDFLDFYLYCVSVSNNHRSWVSSISKYLKHNTRFGRSLFMKNMFLVREENQHLKEAMEC